MTEETGEQRISLRAHANTREAARHNCKFEVGEAVIEVYRVGSDVVK